VERTIKKKKMILVEITISIVEEIMILTVEKTIIQEFK